MRVLRIDEKSPYRRLIGVGGIGSGIFFKLEGDDTLGRNESRLGQLLDVRDYCKLHIVIHYIAKFLGSDPSGSPFHVVPVGKVGDDPVGRQLIREMSDAGIDTRFVAARNNRPTLFSVCFQYPDGSGGNITSSNSAAAALVDSDLDGVSDWMNIDAGKTIALSLPEVSLHVRRRFLEIATRGKAFRAASFVRAEISDAKNAGMFDLLDLVSLNEEEASELMGCAFSEDAPQAFLSRCKQRLRDCWPELRLIVSAGANGAYGVTRDTWFHSPAAEVNVVSTAGAGDSLLGGVLAALAAGIPFLPVTPQREQMVSSALEMGVWLASYKCSSPHTIHPTASLEELLEFAHARGWFFSPNIQQVLT
jgi:sugar/nucleoside kinase (ribokinase family)